MTRLRPMRLVSSSLRPRPTIGRLAQYATSPDDPPQFVECSGCGRIVDREAHEEMSPDPMFPTRLRCQSCVESDCSEFGGVAC